MYRRDVPESVTVGHMEANQLVLVAKARHLSTSGRGGRIRRAADLSLADIGDAIGASPSTVWRWEKGERLPRGAAAAAWAQLLDSLERAGVTS